MISGPLPEITHAAYLVAFYRSTAPGRYLDAAIYSEETPTFTNGTTYDQGCDRSAVLMSATSRHSYQRALDELERRLEADPQLAWVKQARSYVLQQQSRKKHGAGTILQGRQP